MQTFSANFTAAADAKPFVGVDLFEFYLPSYVPAPGAGFDPAEAFELFAGQEITWNGLAYRREVISRGDINLSMGQDQNSCSITFSNVDRYVAALAQSRILEGCFVVIRTVVQLAGVFVTDDSRVLYTGKLGKPSTIDKKTFSIDARQDFGDINVELPTSKFVADDPNGRTPDDLLFEGFRFVATTAQFNFTQRGPNKFNWKAALGLGLVGGLLFPKHTTLTKTLQYSSLDQTPWGQPVPEVFGSCQMPGIPIVWKDTGLNLQGLWAWCKGEIDNILNLTTQGVDPNLLGPFSQGQPYGPFQVTSHTGMQGGTGPVPAIDSYIRSIGGNSSEDFRFPGSGLFSFTAFSGLTLIQGGDNYADVIETPPTTFALIRGRKLDLPDNTGAYVDFGWSDNPVHQTRFIFTNPRFVNINPGFMEDALNYLTSLKCDVPILNDSDDQVIMVSEGDLAVAGERFNRYRSTGLYTPNYFLYNYLGGGIAPQEVDGPYLGFSAADLPIEPGSCPIGQHRDPVDGTCVDDDATPGLVPTQPLLQKRYTANFPITDLVKATDLIWKTLLPTFKGWIKVTKNGKYAILTEEASDSTRIRTAVAIGDTALQILDVTPWKTGPNLLAGRIVLGATQGLTSSEVRDVASALYSTAGNAVTLGASATGTSTATASGATLAGGSTTVRASGTITLGGAPALGNIVRAVINGLTVSYVLTSVDTNATAAAMLASYINAITRLSRFIEAVWDPASPLVITLRAKHGTLNLSSPLLKTHSIGVPDPTTAPTLANTAGGSLAAGTYFVAYTNVTALGETCATLPATVTLTAAHKIAISGLPAFPPGVTSRNFYLSSAANSKTLRFVVARVDAADFAIDALPAPEAALRPSENTTAEELIRVAMSLATNSQDVLPAWKSSLTTSIIPVVLNDIYLPDVLNGHKYKATAITTGITGAAPPVWPTAAGATVIDGGVTWTEFGETVLAQAGLTRANVIKDSYNWPMGSSQSSINQIKGPYRDRKNDFALTPLLVNDREHQAQVGKPYPYEVDLSAVDNFNQANRLCNALLAKLRDGDWFNTMGTGPSAKAFGMEEGDPICSSDDSGGLINVVTRIESLSISPTHQFTINRARLYSTTMFSDDAEKHTIALPTTLRYTGLADSIIEFIDAFAMRDADAVVPGFFVAVARDVTIPGEWRGWILFADYGDGYVEIARGDTASLMGACTSVLDTVTDVDALDTVSTVDITLKYGPDSAVAGAPFVTATEAELRANPYRNLFLIGNEYVQAGTITDVGNNSYTLSDLLRGRFETDTPDFLVHGADERIVFLNGAAKFVAIDESRLGLPFNYKVVTINQNVPAAAVVPFTWTGQSSRGRRMTNPLVVLDASNDFQIEADGNPRTFDVDPEYVCEAWTDATRDDPTKLKRTLQMVSGGTTRAALLSADHTTYDDSGAIIQTSSWAFKNNFIFHPYFGTTVPAITAPFQRIDFSMKYTGAVDGIAFVPATFIVSLQSGVDLTATGVYEVLLASSALSIEWTTDPADLPGTVVETIRSYTTVLSTRHNVDPGFGSISIVSHEVVETGRPGPRYTFLVNGNELSVYLNFNPAGGNIPVAKVTLNPIPYPLRLVVNNVSGSGDDSESFAVRSIMFGGAITPGTIYARREQIEDFTVEQATLFLSLYEKSQIPGIQGIPLDIVVP